MPWKIRDHRIIEFFEASISFRWWDWLAFRWLLPQYGYFLLSADVLISSMSSAECSACIACFGLLRRHFAPLVDVIKPLVWLQDDTCTCQFVKSSIKQVFVYIRQPRHAFKAWPGSQPDEASGVPVLIVEKAEIGYDSFHMFINPFHLHVDWDNGHIDWENRYHPASSSASLPRAIGGNMCSSRVSSTARIVRKRKTSCQISCS